MSSAFPDPSTMDAVARRRAAVLESDELRDTVWDTFADAMAISDEDGIVLAANPAYAELYGYPLADVVGHDFAIIFPEESRAWARDQYRVAFHAAPPPPAYESTVQRADGTQRVVESRVTFVVQNGRRVAMLSTIRDITVRKRAEAAVRQGEERFRLALQDSQITVFEQDLELRYEWIYNPRLGFHANDLIGKTDVEAVPGEDGQRLLDIKRHVLETGQPVQTEVSVAVPDGLHFFDLRVEPRRDAAGGLIGITCVSVDVTAYKRIEERQTSLSELSLLLASSLDYASLLQRLARFLLPRLGDWCIIYLRGEDGEVSRVASAHVDPAKARLMRELAAMPLDTHQAAGVEMVMETGQGLVVPDLDRWLPEDSRHTPQMRLVRQLGLGSGIAVPLKARGTVLGVMSLATQPGRPPLTEADLALATALADRAALFIDNAYLYHQAQAAIRARDEFLSIVSHELKTPLTTLTLVAQFFQQYSRDAAYAARAQARLPQMAASNARQVRRMTGLINDLLDVSRISAGRLDLNLEDVDLAAVARAVVETCADDAAAVGSALTLHAPNPVVGHWDHVRLDQVVTNLVSNAIKYGEGRPIEVAVEGDDLTARLTVRDQGVGIAADDLARIFDPFERTAAARTRQGMGLGLYITRQIATAHGGRVWAESQPGAGSTFVVELPRVKVAPR